MTQIAITSLFLLFSLMANAQQTLTVDVQMDGGEPLPYATVFLNNQSLAAADATGRVSISLHSVHKGDTVSASYCGNGGELRRL